MNSRYAHLAALIILFSLSVTVAERLHQLFAPALLAKTIAVDARDNETAFSLGLRVPITCADQSTIELIPRLPGRVAAELIERDRELHDMASKGGEQQALKTVFGVGDVMAKVLSGYLSLTQPCEKEQVFLSR